MGHAKLSPSASDRWLNCTASVTSIAEVLEKNPELADQTSAPAEEGTAAHELGETALTEKKYCSEYIGQTFNGHVVDQEMAEYVQSYISYVHEQVDLDAGGILLIEQKLPLFYSIKEYGTSDTVVYDPIEKRLHIIDLKYGKGILVSAERNTQLLIYALSALRKYKDWDIKSVEIHIAQPRRQNYSSEIYNMTEMAAWGHMIEGVVKMIEEGRVKFSPGSKQCQWCEASGSCRAQADKYLADVHMDFEDLDIPAPKTSTLTPDELAKLLAIKKGVVKWLEDVQAVAYRTVESGEKIPGYKMVEGRSNRKWTSEEAAFKIMNNSFKKVELYKQKIVSPSQFETLVKENSVKLSSRMKNLVDGVITKPQGKPSLVPESDSREELAPVEDDFADVGDDFNGL